MCLVTTSQRKEPGTITPSPLEAGDTCFPRIPQRPPTEPGQAHPVVRPMAFYQGDLRVIRISSPEEHSQGKFDLHTQSLTLPFSLHEDLGRQIKLSSTHKPLGMGCA